MIHTTPEGMPVSTGFVGSVRDELQLDLVWYALLILLLVLTSYAGLPVAFASTSRVERERPAA